MAAKRAKLPADKLPPEQLKQLIADAARAEEPVLQAELAEPDSPPDFGLQLEEHKLEFQIACLKEELEQLRETHGLRLDYAGHIFKLVCYWLACVVLCVVLSGFGGFGFRLSDSVLIAFITSTTVNVVGLFVLVAKWMFPTKERSVTGSELTNRAESLIRKKPPNQTRQI